MPTKKKTTKKTSSKPKNKFDADDVEKNKIIAALSYIFILCLVPLMLKKNSEFTQFHARQGLTITVAWFVLWVFGIIPILGWIVAFFGNIALLIISVLGVIKTLSGESWEIPFIHEWSKKWNL
ncbi:MAG: DUF4870 domain-containing protein [Candidatus Falkowbacteria bacterium]